MSLEAQLRVERGSFVLEVDMRVAAGEVVAVLGPNGAGKTTLLRTLAGLLAPTSGTVRLGGHPLEAPGIRVPPHERRVGVVFQDYRLFPHLSARENVAFGLRSTGSSRAAARAEADVWLSRLGLAALGDRRPDRLSGGQAQRVALARALVTRPGLLLLDEPLSALDAETRTGVRAELRAVLDGFDGPALMVTHDPLDAMTLADRLIVLEHGRVVQDGSAESVARRPRTPYVAHLVGLSLVRGEASDGVLRLADGSLLVTADSRRQGPSLAVIRPSSVVLSTSAPHDTSARNAWARRIESLEALGDRVRVTLSGPPLHADVTPAAVAQMRLAPGDAVWVSVKATDIETYADPART